ncbi:MAG: hypothetical protein ACI4WW_02770 [Candidatus Coprovivens sp.]
MNENVKKIFDMLGVESNEEFMVDGNPNIWKFNDYLEVLIEVNNAFVFDNNKQYLLGMLVGNTDLIIKLPKKKKLRDLTIEEYKKWEEKNCHKRITDCTQCKFNNVVCSENCSNCWFYYKELYSDKFLDQEIEVE